MTRGLHAPPHRWCVGPAHGCLTSLLVDDGRLENFKTRGGVCFDDGAMDDYKSRVFLSRKKLKVEKNY